MKKSEGNIIILFTLLTKLDPTSDMKPRTRKPRLRKLSITSNNKILSCSTLHEVFKKTYAKGCFQFSNMPRAIIGRQIVFRRTKLLETYNFICSNVIE
jgi:hypothetical protein